jgi:hypothetical protein
MRKIAPAAFLISGILVFGGLFTAIPAQADDDEDEETSSEVLVTPVPTPTAKEPKLDKVPHEPKVPKELKEPKEIKEPGDKRDQLKLKYGKESRLSLPPLVIRPKRVTDEVTETAEVDDDQDDDSDSSSKTSGAASAGSAPAVTSSGSDSSGSDASVGNASAGFIAVNPAAKDSLVTVKSGTLVNPKQNTAIDLTTVEFTKKTPADAFIQAAQVGLYAMAAGAVVLSAVAASRAIRRK